MARTRPARYSFSAGEWSRKMQGRMDLPRYSEAAERIQNMLVQVQGSLTRRPGSRYVAPSISNDYDSALLPWQFNDDQSIVVELGDERAHFFADGGQIVVDGTDAAIVNGKFTQGVDGLSGWSDLSTGSAEVQALTWTVAVAGGTGTAIGNVTGQGGLAAAFSGSSVKDWKACATNSGNRAWIGKDWGSGQTKAITQVTVIGSSDRGLKIKDDPRLTIRLQGSSDNFRKSVVVLDETTAVDRPGIKVTLRPGDTTAYRYHRLEIVGGDDRIGYAVAQLLFYERGATNGRARLVPTGGTAWLQQGVTVGASYQGKRHVLRFDVTAKPGDVALLRIGLTSQGTELVNNRRCGNGSHAVPFVPTDSPVYVQFREGLTEAAVSISNVRIASSAGAVPYAIDTPWDRTHVDELSFTQSADTMWLAHRRYAPRKLIRRGHTDWSLDEVRTIDGPYLDEDPDNTVSIQSDHAVGAATLTASEGIFRPGHVGSLWRLCAAGGVPGHKTWKQEESLTAGTYYRKWDGNTYVAVLGGSATTGNSPPVHEQGEVSDGGVTWGFVNRKGWGWARITGYTSSTVVSAVIEGRVDVSVVASGTTVWREGAFSNVRGWPGTVQLVAGRLAYGKGIDLYLSRPGAYDDFAPTGEDDGAISLRLGGDKVPDIAWLSGVDRIIVGTAAGPVAIRSGVEDDPLTPTNTQARRQSAAGCAKVEPVLSGEGLLYLSRSRQRLYELTDPGDAGRMRAVDVTKLADHVLGSGAKLVTLAEEPGSVIWCLRDDGTLATLTYDRVEETVAWSRQAMGGPSATVRALAVIPGADATRGRDLVWMQVRRAINGAWVRTIEYLEADLRYDASPADAYLVDCGLSFEAPEFDVTAVALGSTAVLVTAPGLAPEKGDRVLIEGLAGSRELNGEVWQVGTVTGPDTFVVRTDLDNQALAPSSVTAWTGGGAVVKLADRLDGLDHLANQTVAINADGADHRHRTVNGSGTVGLDRWCRRAHVGLPISYGYTSWKLPDGGQLGPATGAKQKATRIVVGLVGALVCKVGIRQGQGNFQPTAPLRLADAQHSLQQEHHIGHPPEPYSGEIAIPLPVGSFTDPRVVIEGDDALPLTLTHWLLDDKQVNEVS